MRTFIAIELNDTVHRRICELQDGLQASFPRLRWSEPRHIHLTLKFLGEVDDPQVAGIRAALDRIAASMAPFTVAIRRVGVFPASGAPHVIWAGVDDRTGALGRCRDAIEAGIAPLGFPAESRPFQPHLTLARCPDPRSTRNLRAALEAHRNFDAGERSVRQFALIKSTLTRQGPIHEALSTHELGG